MTMTMCIKRAGLVWALLLLTTTYFILTCAAPSDDATPEPPTVSTTPPVTSTDGENSSKKTTEEAPVTPTVSSDHVPSLSDDDADEYLYYKIKKCIIFERNLTLSDIKYVLSQKDDESQFMYALADKLGYMNEDGKPNDPHLPVIRSYRDKLIELLEEMAAKKEPKPPVSPEDDEGLNVSSNEMPASKEPPSPSDIKKIAYDVSADIHDRLGPDAIQDLLSELTFSDALGYAVGHKLGYSLGDERMKYLENANADELKIILQQTLELRLKTTGKTIPNEPKQSNEPTPIPPTIKPPNIESGVNLQSTEAPSVSDKSKPGPSDGSDDTNGAGNVPSIPEDSGPVPPTSYNSEESDDHGAADLAPETEGEGETSPSEEYMRNSEENDGNKEIPPSKDDKETDGTDYDGGGFKLIPIDEAKRTSLLNSEDFLNYLAETDNDLYKLFVSGEADADDIDMVHVLQEYLVLKDEKGVGEDSRNLETEDTDSPDQPLDSDVQAKEALDSLGDDKDDVEYDHPRSSSSFGALHFLSIFLVLGVLVVIGYFCMHNRKKIREGVATYINDSSKRRRRAREYKPLIST